MVHVASDAGRRARPRLRLRWFVVSLFTGALLALVVALQAGLIDPAAFRAGIDTHTTIEADPTVVLQALTEQADLVVAERNLAPTTVHADDTASVHVPLLGTQDLPQAIAGEEETAQVGPGRVELRVDLSELQPSDVTVAGGTVTVHAPLPRIAEVDQGPVRTIDERSGLLNRAGEVIAGDHQAIQQQELSDAGRERMLDGARQDGELFTRGRRSLDSTLTDLLGGLPGVDRVEVVYPSIAAECAQRSAPDFCAANRGAQVAPGGV